MRREKSKIAFGGDAELGHEFLARSDSAARAFDATAEMHQAEIEFSASRQFQLLARGELRIISAGDRHRHVQPVELPFKQREKPIGEIH